MRVICFCQRRRTSSCRKGWRCRQEEWKYSTGIRLAVITQSISTSSQTSARSKSVKTWFVSCTTRDKTSRKSSWRKTIACYNGFYRQRRAVVTPRSSPSDPKSSLSVTALLHSIHSARPALTDKNASNPSRLSRMMKESKTTQVHYWITSQMTARVAYQWVTQARVKRESNYCNRRIPIWPIWNSRWCRTPQEIKITLWAKHSPFSLKCPTNLARQVIGVSLRRSRTERTKTARITKASARWTKRNALHDSRSRRCEPWRTFRRNLATSDTKSRNGS